MPIISGGGGGIGDISARVHNSGSINTVHNTTKTLTFDSERWDTDTIHSTIANTSRLTVVTAGKYQIEGNISYDSNVAGIRDARVELNGTGVLIAFDRRGAVGGGSPTICTISTQYDLAVGDYVELIAFQNSGGALNVGVVANYSPEFMMQLLAE